MSTQDTTLPPLPAIDDYLPTDGPRWTTANFIACVQKYATDYAQAALAAQAPQPTHDHAAAVRLRGICDDLGLVSAIPETNEQLMAAQFAVFGMIRRALGKVLATCKTCNGHGMVGGPSFYAPDEGGVPCPDCTCPSGDGSLRWPCPAHPQQAQGVPADWLHLKHYGYAPGKYMSRCSDCGQTPAMDKRATRCRPCAETAFGKAQQAQGVPAATLTAASLAAMAAYPKGHLWDSLDAAVCKRAADLLAAAPQAEPQAQAPAPEPSEERRQLLHLLDDIVEEAEQDGAAYYRIRDGKDILFSNMVGACARLLAQPEAVVEAEPQPKREPLTDEQIAEACGWKADMGCKPLPLELRIARAIEQARGIGTKGGDKP